MTLVVGAALAYGADVPCKSKGPARGNCKKPHVITNDDLAAPAARSTPVSSGAASLKPVSSSGSEPADRRGSAGNGTVTVDGLITGGSVSDAQKLLEVLKSDEQTMVKRFEQIEAKLANEQNEQMRKLYSDSLSRRDETLARKRDQIRQVETAIQSAERGR